VKNQRKEIAPTIEKLPFAQQILLWKIVATGGMNEAQIQMFAEQNGLVMPHMGNLSDKTMLLSRDHEGQWRVKPEFSSAIKIEMEKTQMLKRLH
jgi:hypothetical protein